MGLFHDVVYYNSTLPLPSLIFCLLVFIFYFCTFCKPHRIFLFFLLSNSQTFLKKGIIVDIQIGHKKVFTFTYIFILLMLSIPKDSGFSSNVSFQLEEFLLAFLIYRHAENEFSTFRCLKVSLFYLHF